MQKVIYYENGKQTRKFTPIGWDMLKPGAEIKATDKFFEFDTGLWKSIPEVDVGDKVGLELDIIIRMSSTLSLDDAEPDKDKTYTVPEGY